MFANWDAFDVIGWGLVLLAVLLFAALVTYLVRAWGAVDEAPRGDRVYEVSAGCRGGRVATYESRQPSFDCFFTHSLIG